MGIWDDVAARLEARKSDPRVQEMMGKLDSYIPQQGGPDPLQPIWDKVKKGVENRRVWLNRNVPYPGGALANTVADFFTVDNSKDALLNLPFGGGTMKRVIPEAEMAVREAAALAPEAVQSAKQFAKKFIPMTEAQFHALRSKGYLGEELAGVDKFQASNILDSFRTKALKDHEGRVAAAIAEDAAKAGAKESAGLNRWQKQVAENIAPQAPVAESVAPVAQAVAEVPKVVEPVVAQTTEVVAPVVEKALNPGAQKAIAAAERLKAKKSMLEALGMDEAQAQKAFERGKLFAPSFTEGLPGAERTAALAEARTGMGLKPSEFNRLLDSQGFVQKPASFFEKAWDKVPKKSLAVSGGIGAIGGGVGLYNQLIDEPYTNDYTPSKPIPGGIPVPANVTVKTLTPEEMAARVEEGKALAEKMKQLKAAGY